MKTIYLKLMKKLMSIVYQSLQKKLQKIVINEDNYMKKQVRKMCLKQIQVVCTRLLLQRQVINTRQKKL